MKSKRLMSLALAGLMSLSLMPSALASGKTTKVTATYKDIPISVIVPTTGQVTINPYSLPVNFTNSKDVPVPIAGQQITTAPMAIKNQGTVGLDVTATVTGTLKTGSTMTLSPTTTQGTTPLTTKTAFVQLQVVTLQGKKYNVADNDDLADAIIAAAADEDVTWASPTEGPVVEIGKTNETADDTVLASLHAANMDATTGEFATYYGKDGEDSSIALFRLSGDCVVSPKTGTGTTATANPWTSKDGFDASIVFSFTPTA